MVVGVELVVFRPSVDDLRELGMVCRELEAESTTRVFLVVSAMSY